MTPVNIKELVANKVGYKYPNIIVKELSPAFTTTMRNLEEGECMLIGRYKGKEKAFDVNISLSAINIKKLLTTTGSLILNIADGKSADINSVEDYMEAVNRWI